MSARSYLYDFSDGFLLTPRMTPRSLIGFANGLEFGDQFDSPPNNYGYGFATRDGVDRSIGFADSGAGFGQTREFYSTKFCGVGTAAPSPGAEAGAWLPRRVEILDTGSGTGTQSLHGVVLGGRTLLAQAGQFTTDDSGGTQAVTGIGFQPEMVLFSTANTVGEEGVEDSGLLMYGVVDENLDQWCVESFADFFADSNFSGLFQGGVMVDVFTGALSATIVSLDADGFTIDWVGAGSGALVAYLALADPYSLAYFRCGVVDVGGSHTINTLPYRPQAVMFQTTSFGPLDTINDRGIISVGAASPGGVQTCASGESTSDLLNPGRFTSRSQRLNACGFELQDAVTDFLTVNTWTNTGFQTSWDGDDHFYGWAAIRCSPDVSGSLPVLGVG